MRKEALSILIGLTWFGLSVPACLAQSVTGAADEITSTEQGMALAIQFSQKGDTARALATLRKLVAKYPDDLESRLALGAALISAGENKSALEQLRKAEQIEEKSTEKSADVHMLCAQALVATGDFMGAIHENQLAIAIEPDNPEPHLMAVLNMISEPVLCKQAQHELEVAEKLGCDDPRLPGLKGIVQAELGQYDAALIQLKDALKSVDPSMQKWQHDLQAEIAKVEAIKKSQKPPTVPPEKRKYNIPDGAAALILHVDHVKKLTTMKFSDGHDPDRGKQDGLDDGIIEMPSTTVRPPDSVLRPK